MPARAVRRLHRRAGARDRYAAFQAAVERELLARPRLHRFGRAPEALGLTAPVPVAVGIDVEEGGDVAVTRASLERQTVAPAAVAEARDAETVSALRADWVAVVRAGDMLAPSALETLGRAAAAAGGATLITCDDDVLDRRGRRAEPRCRPGPSPDLMRECDLTGALIGLEPEAAAQALPAGSDRATWRHDLALALAGPDGAGHVHVPSILCHRAGRPALTPARRRIARPLHDEPTVEAIVCFRDRPDLLRRCVESVLRRTAYERLTLRLVDNASEDPEVAGLLATLARDLRVTVDRDPRPFNFSALNNAAAARSQADFLVFLNNDTEVLTESWVEDLLAEAQRPEVGAVAPLLLYGDGRVQHAGAAIGLHGYAGHPFAGLRPDDRTPFGSATDGTRNWLAVTAACMMVERRKLDAVGGFEEGFTVAGSDVDLCLRLLAAGHRSLCLPHVTLRHDESASRDPLDLPETDYSLSRERYGAFRTVGDPFYNPNLTLTDTTCDIRESL